jgi:putative ABC transport system permease protein
MIFFGIFMAIIGVAMNNGMSKQAIESYIRTEIGTILIYPAEYDNDRENNNIIDFDFKDETKIIHILQNHPQIVAYTPRVKFTGSFTNGKHEFPATFVGIDTELEDMVFKRSDTIIDGNYLNSEDLNKVIIGKNTANLLNLKTGDFITLIARDYKKGMNAYDVEIKGIFESGNLKIDDGYVFMSKNFAQTFSQKTKINEIIITTQISEKKYVNEIAKDLNNNMGKDISIIPWYVEIEDFLKFMELDEKSGFVFTFLLLIMAGLGIANTLIMAVFERKREIGIFFAMGFSRKKMLTLFTLEGIVVGAIGAFTALVFGSVLVYYFYRYGIYIPMGEEFTGGDIPLGNRIYGYISPLKMLVYSLSGIIISAIASIYPAYYATKLNPVEIMKNS